MFWILYSLLWVFEMQAKKSVASCWRKCFSSLFGDWRWQLKVGKARWVLSLRIFWVIFCLLCYLQILFSVSLLFIVETVLRVISVFSYAATSFLMFSWIIYKLLNVLVTQGPVACSCSYSYVRLLKLWMLFCGVKYMWVNYKEKQEKACMSLKIRSNFVPFHQKKSSDINLDKHTISQRI